MGNGNSSLTGARLILDVLEKANREQRDFFAWLIHRLYDDQTGERPMPAEIVALHQEADTLRDSGTATVEEQLAVQRRIRALYMVEYEADRAQGRYQ